MTLFIAVVLLLLGLILGGLTLFGFRLFSREETHTSIYCFVYPPLAFLGLVAATMVCSGTWFLQGAP